MLLRTVKLLGLATAICVVGIAVGVPLANAWYADDACQIDAWKCDLGSIGFAIAFLGAIGAVAFGLASLILGLAYAWRRR